MKAFKKVDNTKSKQNKAKDQGIKQQRKEKMQSRRAN